MLEPPEMPLSAGADPEGAGVKRIRLHADEQKGTIAVGPTAAVGDVTDDRTARGGHGV